MEKIFKLLEEIEDLKNEQKNDKAAIKYLEGFVKGLETRISSLERQEK